MHELKAIYEGDTYVMFFQHQFCQQVCFNPWESGLCKAQIVMCLQHKTGHIQRHCQKQTGPQPRGIKMANAARFVAVTDTRLMTAWRTQEYAVANIHFAGR
jgi:hypothetical protein